jgi:hypothetical protein
MSRLVFHRQYAIAQLVEGDKLRSESLSGPSKGSACELMMILRPFPRFSRISR